MMSAVQARNNFVSKEKVCEPWIGTISNDINNASADSDSVELRRDEYYSKSCLTCTTELKAKLRHAGHCVYENVYETDDYQPCMTVDWSNTWTASWYDLKDRFGLVAHHRKW